MSSAHARIQREEKIAACLEPHSKCRKSAPAAEVSTSGTARHFVPAWKTMFPWVFLDKGTRMCCRYCIDAGKANAFTRGCDKFKKAALMKHVATVDHRAALEA